MRKKIVAVLLSVAAFGAFTAAPSDASTTPVAAPASWHCC